MIPDNYKPIRQLGNGSTVSFSFDFPLISENFIKVFRERNGVQSEVGRSEYTVSFDGQGGSVTFNTAPKKNDVIVVTRDIPLEQETPYKTSSGFPAVRVEDNFDKLTAITQQLNEIAGRCVKVNVTGDQTPEELLDEVYGKLDSATEVAEQAIGAANQATTAAKNANDAVIVAQQQITETQAFIEQARTDITNTANTAVSTINTTVDTAQANITSSIEEALDYVSQEAVNAATNVVADVVGQYTDRAETAAVSAEADANSAATSAASASANAIKAETNATEVATYNFKNKITNCITEIPQDIKLEINNGTLTLKAGSKLTWGGGADYKTYITTTDQTKTFSGTTADGQYFIFVARSNGSIQGPILVSKVSSGTLANRPSTANIADIYYSTDNNKFNYYGTTAWNEDWAVALPIAIVTITSSTIASIDQVFNGLGYMGSTVFALPGVKGLIPDGRNADGSLKNIEFTTSKVLTYSRGSAFTNYDLILKGIDCVTSVVSYDEESNRNLTTAGANSGYAIVGKVSATTGGVITSFATKLPFRAADMQEVNLKQDEATAVNYDNITNCITEIPQDIKWELANNVFRVEVGSKVYVPNGAGKFDEVVFTSSVGIDGSSSGTNKWIIVYNYVSKNLERSVASNCASGSTQPTLNNYGFWYDTTNNVIKRYVNNAWSYDKRSLPICIVNCENNVITSIDQVFNGFGYIGSTVFVLPGVKGLIPDGRNADGTLKNLEIINSKVKTGQVVNGNRTLVLTPSSVAGYADTIYHTESNINTNSAGAYQDCCHCGKVVVENGAITLFTPKLPFRAVDDQEVVKTRGDQTIGGVKTFTDAIERVHAFGASGTPSIKTTDSNGKGYIAIQPYYAANTIYNRLFAYNSTANKQAYVDVSIKDAGTSNVQLYADTVIAPTPASTSNGTNVATTAWVINYVKNTGGGANWASKVSVTRDTNYTAPSNGYIAAYMQFDDTSGTLTINSVQIFNAGGNVVSPSFTFVPVSKGDVINIGGGAWVTAYFVPFK